MTQRKPAWTEFLFPVLLLICGTLGLIVINLISQQGKAADRRSQATAPAGAHGER